MGLMTLHYLKRTIFGKFDLLFACALPIAIMWVLFTVFADAEIMPLEQVTWLAGFFTVNLTAMFVMFSGQTGTFFFFKDLKNTGVRDRLFVTPQPQIKFITSIIIASVIFSLIANAVNVAFGILVLGATITNPLITVLTLITLAIYGTVLNIAIFSFVTSENTAQLVGNIVTFGLSFLGGVFSYEPLPSLSPYIPTKMAFDAIQDNNWTAFGGLWIWIACLGLICYIGTKRKPL